MKIRKGFVTNSSSSSFIVMKQGLSDEQIDKIRNYTQVAKKLKLDYADYAYEWQVHEKNDRFTGSTIIDNFSMEEFFEAIRLPKFNYHINYD